VLITFNQQLATCNPSLVPPIFADLLGILRVFENDKLQIRFQMLASTIGGILPPVIHFRTGPQGWFFQDSICSSGCT
jgi:hypothetical protein